MIFIYAIKITMIEGPCFIYVGSKWDVTRNARWRSRRPRYKATVHVPDFQTHVPAPEDSSRYNRVVIFLKGLFFASASDSSEWKRECQNPVRKRQLCSGDVGYVTWRSQSYVHQTRIASIGSCYVDSRRLCRHRTRGPHQWKMSETTAYCQVKFSANNFRGLWVFISWINS